MKQFRLWERVLIAFCASAVLLTMVDLAVPAEERAIYDTVIRLHVLARSDSREDQQVKLLVRDAITEECSSLFVHTDNTTDALRQMEQASREMEDIANRVLRENGFSYTATAVFGRETYPTRVYDGVSFPAGEYYSLRILLGEGEGQNWWCCLFPPLCLSASSDERLDSVGIDTSSGKVFTKKKYQIRFKFLEWFSCFIE